MVGQPQMGVFNDSTYQMTGTSSSTFNVSLINTRAYGISCAILNSSNWTIAFPLHSGPDIGQDIAHGKVLVKIPPSLSHSYPT